METKSWLEKLISESSDPVAERAYWEKMMLYFPCRPWVTFDAARLAVESKVQDQLEADERERDL